MRIYWLQQFWFGDVVYNDTDNHPHYGMIASRSPQHRCAPG
jgi:hypothetical protein